MHRVYFVGLVRVYELSVTDPNAHVVMSGRAGKQVAEGYLHMIDSTCGRAEFPAVHYKDVIGESRVSMAEAWEKAEAILSADLATAQARYRAMANSCPQDVMVTIQRKAELAASGVRLPADVKGHEEETDGAAADQADVPQEHGGEC